MTSAFGENYADSYTGENTYGSTDFRPDVFYRLQIDGNNGSSKHLLKVDGKLLDGFYEAVQFLADVRKLRIIHFHDYNKQTPDEDTRGKAAWLCNKTFDPMAGCPVCAHRQKLTKAGNHRAAIATSMKSVLLAPVYVLGRNKTPLVKNGRIISPINWLDIQCHIKKFKDPQGNWGEDKAYFENYTRLLNLARVTPTTDSFYMVWQKTRGENEKKHYEFAALKPNTGMLEQALSFKHPLVQDWINNGKLDYDQDYYDIITAMSLVRFKQWADPETGDVFDYGGKYERAVAIYEANIEGYPRAFERLDDDGTTAPALPTI